MMKICMIGNSHVAAMRLAWDQVAPDHPDTEVSIYGGHARNLVSVKANAAAALQFDGPPLWSFRVGTEPSRARSIPLAGVDAVVITGCDFGPPCVFRTYKRYHFAGLKGRRKQALTREYFKRAVSEEATASAAGVLASCVQAAVAAPVFLVPTPLPAEAGFSDMDKPRMEPYRAARDSGDGEALMALFGELCAELQAKNITVIRQPEVTKASELATLQSYSDNSARLRADDDALHPENDYFHMNASYGQLVWADIFDAIAARRGS
jgi:hypothetical protein